MNTRTNIVTPLLTTAIASLLMVACSSTPSKPDAAIGVRQKLSQLQANPQLASRAPIAIEEAEAAVRAAETPSKDDALTNHRVFMAERKVDTAVALAQSRMLVDHRKVLSDERDSMRLQARTNEADRAHVDANIARSQADQALVVADAARLQNAALKQQIAELNARETDRGLVVTLGDVLFATGRAELKGGATSNLSKLAAFLNEYPDRTVAIEGHTDSTGSESFNMNLSQRRADSVKTYLVGQGIAAYRVSTLGKGEGYPVSGNDSATGRQQNRRVEVIIANTIGR
ncbi:MAG: OmpA family protein [Xanthomonadaceae bacterium]|nr:OmpA family protein [Xanthomonadaceae bacterium]MDP2185713.1 OmpA family protein [Xanthomonadales bacterium]MDZ4114996.1 OmpA family protein [Xanthomonadaceae bacterium]MDZ4378094.1 OmpA family protein [Xanthomonadaceae bacterium]